MAKKKNEGILSGFKTAQEILEEEQELCVCVPVSPCLDEVLGGGIPSGSLVAIQAKSNTGKTSLVMSILRNSLLQGRKCFYYDLENRLSPKKYFAMDNFNPNNPDFKYKSSTEEYQLNGDDVLTEQIKLMRSAENYGAVYVFDSLSKLIPKEVIEDDEVKGNRRSTTAKLQNDWLAKAGQLIRTSGSIVIVIQHLMVDQSSMMSYGGPQLKAKGSDAIIYDSDIIFSMKSNPADLDGNTQFKEEELTGLCMKLKVPKNKLRGPLNTRDGVQTFIKFGKGVFNAKELLIQFQKLLDPKNPTGDTLVNRSGAWFQFNFEKFTEKVQGSDAAIALIEQNEEYFMNFYKKIMEDTYDTNYEFKAKK